MTIKNLQNQQPVIAPSDSDIALVSKWKVNDPGHQNIAGDVAIDTWKHLLWPEGLISHSVFLGTDKVTIMQYSQWTDEEAIETFTRKNLAERAERANKEVPGLDRIEAVKYRHYRSMVSEDISRHPECIILVSFETDGPERQSEFVDTLIEMVESRDNPHHPGSIASHFHVSLDGKRVLNYAEFIDEQSHEEMVLTMLHEDDEVPRLISNMPGLNPLGFERYRLYKSLSIQKTER